MVVFHDIVFSPLTAELVCYPSIPVSLGSELLRPFMWFDEENDDSSVRVCALEVLEADIVS